MGFRLFGQIDGVGSRLLHAISQLVRLDPRFELVFAGPALSMMPVERFEQIEPAALLAVGDMLGRLQVQNRRTVLLKVRALISRRQKPGAPVRGPATYDLVVGQNHERRKVFVGAAPSP